MLTITFLAVFVGGLAIIVTTVIFKSIRTARKKRDASDHIDRGKNMDAIRHLVEVVQDNPDDLVSLFDLATLQIQTGLPFEGLQNVKKLLERNLAGSGVIHVEAILLGAKAEFALGNRKEGYKYLMMAKGIDSTSLEVNVSLAASTYDEGNYLTPMATLPESSSWNRTTSRRTLFRDVRFPAGILIQRLVPRKSRLCSQPTIRHCIRWGGFTGSWAITPRPAGLSVPH